MQGRSLRPWQPWYDRLAGLAAEAETYIYAGDPVPEELGSLIADLLGEDGAMTSDVGVDGFGRFLLKLREREDQCSEESKVLAERAARFEKLRRAFGSFIAKAMAAARIKKVEGAEVTLTRVAGREKVVVDDISKVPDEFMLIHVAGVCTSRAAAAAVAEAIQPHTRDGNAFIEMSVDKQKLGRALATGEVPGVSIGVGDDTLRAYISGSRKAAAALGERVEQSEKSGAGSEPQSSSAAKAGAAPPPGFPSNTKESE